MRSTLSTSMPIPKIMVCAAPASSSRRAHQRFHIAHGLGQAVDYGARHDRVPDVELDDFRNGGDRLDVVVVETMTRIDDQPEARGKFRCGAQPFEFARTGGARGFGIRA